jgi:hypothetical protein
MDTDNHVKMGGMVLCKKLCPDKSYIFRWCRKDHVYRSKLFTIIAWIKEKFFFIKQWHPVGKEEFQHIFNVSAPE